MSERLGLEHERTGRWLAFAAGLHDFGKASPAFQVGALMHISPALADVVKNQVVGAGLPVRRWRPFDLDPKTRFLSGRSRIQEAKNGRVDDA